MRFPWLLKAGAQGISIALLNQSVDRTLQVYFSNKLSVSPGKIVSALQIAKSVDPCSALC